MSEDTNTPRALFSVDPATKAAVGRITGRDHCACLAVRAKSGAPLVPSMHVEAQDETAPGWSETKSYSAEVALTRSPVFEPSATISWDNWMRVVTLPSEVSKLSDVKEVKLYGSHLRRLPPEIGALSSLEDLDIYTSYSLHWLPYEVMRCGRLLRSRMSTRALYGNIKNRLPFPRLSGPIETLLPKTCSVCDRGFGERAPQLRWTTQRIGTDIVPLLIHSCSEACTASVPISPSGYFEAPHKGGGGVGMPTINV